jgi:hypothetical protein
VEFVFLLVNDASQTCILLIEVPEILQQLLDLTLVLGLVNVTLEQQAS